MLNKFFRPAYINSDGTYRLNTSKVTSIVINEVDKVTKYNTDVPTSHVTTPYSYKTSSFRTFYRKYFPTLSFNISRSNSDVEVFDTNTGSRLPYTSDLPSLTFRYFNIRRDVGMNNYDTGTAIVFRNGGYSTTNLDFVNRFFSGISREDYINIYGGNTPSEVTGKSITAYTLNFSTNTSTGKRVTFKIKYYITLYSTRNKQPSVMYEVYDASNVYINYGTKFGPSYVTNYTYRRQTEYITKIPTNITTFKLTPDTIKINKSKSTLNLLIISTGITNGIFGNTMSHNNHKSYTYTSNENVRELFVDGTFKQIVTKLHTNATAKNTNRLSSGIYPSMLGYVGDKILEKTKYKNINMIMPGGYSMPDIKTTWTEAGNGVSKSAYDSFNYKGTNAKGIERLEFVKSVMDSTNSRIDLVVMDLENSNFPNNSTTTISYMTTFINDLYSLGIDAPLVLGTNIQYNTNANYQPNISNGLTQLLSTRDFITAGPDLTDIIAANGYQYIFKDVESTRQAADRWIDKIVSMLSYK